MERGTAPSPLICLSSYTTLHDESTFFQFVFDVARHTGGGEQFCITKIRSDKIRAGKKHKNYEKKENKFAELF